MGGRSLFYIFAWCWGLLGVPGLHFWISWALGSGGPFGSHDLKGSRYLELFVIFFIPAIGLVVVVLVAVLGDFTPVIGMSLDLFIP